MASIAGTNAAYLAYRNAIVGDASHYAYSTVLTNVATTLYSFFSDDGTVTPDDTHIFQSSYTTSENPAFAVKLVLGSVTLGPTVGTAVVDAADAVFTGVSALTGVTSVESLIVFKFITNAAASPVLVHFGSATGLPLVPNAADVTVVWNASGIWSI